MNKTLKKVFIAISCVCVAVILIGIGIIAYIESGVKNRDAQFISLSIERAESAYSEDKTYENLLALCDLLCFSGEDEKIISYFPQLLFDSQYDEHFQTDNEKALHDGYLTSYFVSIYRTKGANALYSALEKDNSNYFFPTEKYEYLVLMVVNTLIPQKSEDVLGIHQVFVQYADEQGPDEDKKLAHSAYESMQDYVKENTQADGTLYIAEE